MYELRCEMNLHVGQASSLYACEDVVVHYLDLSIVRPPNYAAAMYEYNYSQYNWYLNRNIQVLFTVVDLSSRQGFQLIIGAALTDL